MDARIWGCRGSLAAPGPETARYGGNSPCVELRPAAGGLVVLDAGTGIRPLGEAVLGVSEVHILLTHLHLDHVEGLGFFSPLHDPACRLTIWGPPQEGSSLAARLATWLSPPFFPVPFAKIADRLDIHEVRDERWAIGALSVSCAVVEHPGTTLGFRIEEGGRSLVYVPDVEADRDASAAVALARGADVLLHDAQYTVDEYTSHAGWGHSSLAGFAAVVADAAPQRALMFHHDPAHDDDDLEAMRDGAAALAGREVELARENLVL